MKVTVDGVDLFELSDIQKKVMMHDISEDDFEAFCKDKLQWILTHKYEQCMKRLKEEWDVKLQQNGVAMLPTRPEVYAKLVFQQSNYKNRKQRDSESSPNQSPEN
jgi:hypothetical protein